MRQPRFNVLIGQSAVLNLLDLADFRFARPTNASQVTSTDDAPSYNFEECIVDFYSREFNIRPSERDFIRYYCGIDRTTMKEERLHAVRTASDSDNCLRIVASASFAISEQNYICALQYMLVSGLRFSGKKASRWVSVMVGPTLILVFQWIGGLLADGELASF
jgi:hypothetical protein